MATRPNRIAVRAALGCLLAAVLTVTLSATGTFSSFTTAKIQNSIDTTASSLLSISHAYNSTTCAATQTATNPQTSCLSSAYPATVTSTTASRTDTITNTGTTPAGVLSARYQIASCGPVALANTVSGGANGAMLPRTGTTFAPTGGPTTAFGAITENGSTGYASSVAATTEPTGPAVIGTQTYGIGVWFNTTSTKVYNPILGFGSNPLAGTTGTSDRTLYLNASGQIGFYATTTAVAGPGTATGVTKYNDGAWHFAYVAISSTRIIAGLGFSVTVYVDNKSAATLSLPLTSLSSYSGYWHAGYAPIGGVGYYYAGSLSSLVVDDSGSAPTTPGSNPTSPTGFDSTTRTELWTFGDSGGSYSGTTTGGTLPSSTTLPSSAGNPCAAVTITWTVASTTIANAVALSTLPSATVSTGPAPSATQTSTITLSHGSSINSYLTGLILYAPVLATYTAGTGASTWTLPFVWNAPAAGTVAGSTVVIA